MQHSLPKSVVVSVTLMVCACASSGIDGDGLYPTTYILPEDYDPSRSWPAILFLHGAFDGAGAGTIEGGVPAYAEAHPDFPFVVVAPRTEQDWNVGVLALVLEDAKQQYSIDENRIYLTGLSTGGQAAWELGVALPDLFAALAPVAAEGNALGISLCNIAHVPVRAFHNENDPVYPIWQTRDMIDTLNACGGNAQLTVYPSGEHDAWTETYNGPELYDWFLAN